MQQTYLFNNVTNNVAWLMVSRFFISHVTCNSTVGNEQYFFTCCYNDKDYSAAFTRERTLGAQWHRLNRGNACHFGATLFCGQWSIFFIHFSFVWSLFFQHRLLFESTWNINSQLHIIDKTVIVIVKSRTRQSPRCLYLSTYLRWLLHGFVYVLQKAPSCSRDIPT